MGARAGRVQGRGLRPSLSHRPTSASTVGRPTPARGDRPGRGRRGHRARPAHQVVGGRTLQPGSIHLFWTLRLDLTRNTGAAFSLIGGQGPLIGVLALGVVGALLWQGRSVSSRDRAGGARDSCSAARSATCSTGPSRRRRLHAGRGGRLHRPAVVAGVQRGRLARRRSAPSCSSWSAWCSRAGSGRVVRAIERS